MARSRLLEAKESRSPIVLVVLVPLVAGLLIGNGSSSTVGLAAVLALAPLIALAIAAMSLETLVLTLVFSTQLQVARAFVVGFHFLPEHFVLVVLVAALVIRAPHIVFRRPAAYEALLLAWVAWNAIVSLLVSPDLQNSLAIVGWMSLAWMIMWTARGVLGLTEEGFRRVVNAGGWLASVLGLIAFGLWLAALLDVAHLLVQPEFVTGAVGAKGPALEANLFGSGELMWFYWLLRQRALHRRYVPTWQIAALVLGIGASMTRAVWLATVVVLVGSMFLRRPGTSDAGADAEGTDRTKGQVTLVFGVILLGVVLAFATPAGQKFSESLNFRETTGASRASGWQLALKDVSKADAIVMGLGTHSYGVRHESPTLRGKPDYLSNFPLTLLYDTGLIGLALFGGAMLAFVLRSGQPATRLMNLLFVLAVLIAGAATSPIWFGFVWVMVAAIDVDRPEQQPYPDESAGEGPAGVMPMTVGV
ncbi:MAG TPA: hypothetical protein VM121_11640 [Acidimicrobiales bacterium]|nr:hypothetical protein [Acidimicrobiales bacterium]